MVASLRVNASTKQHVCGPHMATTVRAAAFPVARLPSMTRTLVQNTRPMVAVNAAPQNVNAAAAANPTIRIKLKSYWTDLLQDTVDKITEVASTTGATISGPVPLPTRKRVYTVLRSPHVNKKSREQFEVRTHQRLIDIKDLSTQTIDRLMELDLPAGVDVEVKL
jgi:small subunit ribosomal protein S10